MMEQITSSDDPKKYENELKLYTLLVDQLLKYQATIWQIPTALVVGNFLAIDKFLTKPIPLMALVLFDIGLIFVFYRMIKSQRSIIVATKTAERKLKPVFREFLPRFKRHKCQAPIVFVWILYALVVGLGIYIVDLFLSPPPSAVVTNERAGSYQQYHIYHYPARDTCATLTSANADTDSVDKK
jgi:multisubunit Na+/H+ antiporter MnhC subunit